MSASFPSHAVSARTGEGVSTATLLRLLVGAYYLPHVYSKVAGFESTMVFFGKAGFHPAAFFVAFSAVAELAVAVALITGRLAKYAALASVGLMVVAAYAIAVVKGLGWFWAGGGVEYLIFWALASGIVFVQAWRADPGLFGIGRDIRL